MTSLNDGPSKPSAKTYNLLYTKSSNRCTFPTCKNPITLNQTLVGNVATSKQRNPEGPRYDPTQTNEERDRYDNLLLMCSIHNKVVVDDEATYTVDHLKQMKADHEAESTPIQEEIIRIAVDLLVSGKNTVTTQSGDIAVINNFGSWNFLHETLWRWSVDRLRPRRK